MTYLVFASGEKGLLLATDDLMHARQKAAEWASHPANAGKRAWVVTPVRSFQWAGDLFESLGA